MKLAKLKELILSNATKTENGSLDNIDWSAINSEINDNFNELIKNKQPDLEQVKQDTINEYLKDKGFETSESLETFITNSKESTTKYTELQSEIKSNNLNQSITNVLKEFNTPDKYKGAINKLLTHDGLYDEEGKLLDDKLKENIQTIITDDLKLEPDLTKIGVQLNDAQQPKTRPKIKF
jgi:hypothetical protein